MLSRRHFLGSTAAALAAGAGGVATAAGPLNIVTTTGMIADAATQIGGDGVLVQSLMGAGIDPHSYRQTRSDILALTRADLVLWHGLYLEAQMEDFLLRLGERQDVTAVTDMLRANGTSLIGSDEYEGRFDPHVWMDPSIWTAVTGRIATALTSHRPELADLFAANLATHVGAISALTSYGQTAMDQIAPENRVLVTAHDAFGYFGAAFDMEVMGVQGISTENEAGLHRIGEMVDLLVEREVRAVFVESSVSDQNIRALVEGAAAKGHEVRLGGELFSDAMGMPGTYEGTYVGMIDHNITTIARALGADVPQAGLNGRLSAGS